MGAVMTELTMRNLGSRTPIDLELKLAYDQGHHVASIAKRLAQ